MWVKNYVVTFVFEDARLKRQGLNLSLKCSSVLNFKTNDLGGGGGKTIMSMQPDVMHHLQNPTE